MMKELTRPDNLEQDERIRWVPGYEGHYAVTDRGRVFSYRRSKVIEMKGGAHESGYRMIPFSVNGKQRTMYAHRIVLEAFVGACPSDRLCRHLDGNPTNNRVSNLEWGTAEENQRDRVNHALNAAEIMDRDKRTKMEQPYRGWRSFLNEEPIPSWALREGIFTARMTWYEFAERSGLDRWKVKKFLSSERPLSGADAVAARMILG